MYKLLIVDDEYEIRNGLYNFSWKEIGFVAVGQAENGKEALEFIQHNNVDVVLCDVRMPVMDGLEFARIIMEKSIHVKIIFLSGFRDFEYVRCGMQYGGKDYLLKPTKFRRIIEVFTRIKKQLDDELIEKYENSRKEEYAHSDKTISVAIKYMNEHLSSTNLEDTADFVQLSPQYFSKYFKEKTGRTFADYLTECRMEKASALLRDVRNKVYEIASEVGYSNPQNFTRAFKCFFGVSPNKYRENMN